MKINRWNNTVKVKNPVVIVEMGRDGVLQFAWFGNDRADGSPPPLEVMATVIAGIVNTGAVLLEIDSEGIINVVRECCKEQSHSIRRMDKPR